MPKAKAEAAETPNPAQQIIARSKSFAEFLRQHQPSPLETVKHIEGFCAELEVLAGADAADAADEDAA